MEKSQSIRISFYHYRIGITVFQELRLVVSELGCSNSEVFGQWKGRAVKFLDGGTIGGEIGWHSQKDDNDVPCLQDWKLLVEERTEKGAIGKSCVNLHC
jgi:hypothetical protein